MSATMNFKEVWQVTINHNDILVTIHHGRAISFISCLYKQYNYQCKSYKLDTCYDNDLFVCFNAIQCTITTKFYVYLMTVCIIRTFSKYALFFCPWVTLQHPGKLHCLELMPVCWLLLYCKNQVTFVVFRKVNKMLWNLISINLLIIISWDSELIIFLHKDCLRNSFAVSSALAVHVPQSCWQEWTLFWEPNV